MQETMVEAEERAPGAVPPGSSARFEEGLAYLLTFSEGLLELVPDGIGVLDERVLLRPADQAFFGRLVEFEMPAHLALEHLHRSTLLGFLPLQALPHGTWFPQVREPCTIAAHRLCVSRWDRRGTFPSSTNWGMNVQHRTSNIQRPSTEEGPAGEWFRLTMAHCLPSMFRVLCSMFGVRYTAFDYVDKVQVFRNGKLFLEFSP